MYLVIYVYICYNQINLEYNASFQILKQSVNTLHRIKFSLVKRDRRVAHPLNDY